MATVIKSHIDAIMIGDDLSKLSKYYLNWDSILILDRKQRKRLYDYCLNYMMNPIVKENLESIRMAITYEYFNMEY